MDEGQEQNIHQPSSSKASQSKLVDISFQDGEIVTEAGFSFLRGLDGAFTARKDSSMQTALVLGLKGSQSTSLIEKSLGKLRCQRCEILIMMPVYSQNDKTLGEL